MWEPGRRGQETGFLSLAFCSVGSEKKKKKKNEAAKEAETPPAKKIKPQTPNTFPKRKKVGCLVSSQEPAFRADKNCRSSGHLFCLAWHARSSV